MKECVRVCHCLKFSNCTSVRVSEIFSFCNRSCRSHFVEESFWRRLWTCRQTEYRMNDECTSLTTTSLPLPLRHFPYYCFRLSGSRVSPAIKVQKQNGFIKIWSEACTVSKRNLFFFVYVLTILCRKKSFQIPTGQDLVTSSKCKTVFFFSFLRGGFWRRNIGEKWQHLVYSL